MPLIDIHDVRKNFGKLEVLKGVSIDVEQGAVVAIIGKSGSGKSTLLRCVNGLETYDSGVISVEGVRVHDQEDRLRELRRKVGMVFQQFNLFPHLTAGENVMLAPRVVNGVSKAEVPSGAGQPGARGACGEVRQLSQPAFRRAAAACGHRTRHLHAAQGAAVRRDHLRAGP